MCILAMLLLLYGVYSYVRTYVCTYVFVVRYSVIMCVHLCYAFSIEAYVLY